MSRYLWGMTWCVCVFCPSHQVPVICSLKWANSSPLIFRTQVKSFLWWLRAASASSVAMVRKFSCEVIGLASASSVLWLVAFSCLLWLVAWSEYIIPCIPLKKMHIYYLKLYSFLYCWMGKLMMCEVRWFYRCLCSCIGLQHEGIFRVSGSQVEVNDIKNAFERGKRTIKHYFKHIVCLWIFINFSLASVFASDSRVGIGEDPLAGDQNDHDMDSIAGVLKLYFRGLDHALFPKEVFHDLISCVCMCPFLKYACFFCFDFDCLSNLSVAVAIYFSSNGESPGASCSHQEGSAIPAE